MQGHLDTEDTVETISVAIGLALRIALPIAFMFWISARLRAWDQERGASC
jgi:hypothetical protein